MADTKISALPASTTPLAGTEVLPIVQSSVTVKVSVDNLTVKNIRSNATNGILQIAGPAAAATRVMTTPDANFTVARTDAAQSFTGNQTLSTGNLVIGTSGQGIDFSATPGTGTSELLADYEEGTWTPTLTSAGGNFTTIAYGDQQGTYTKIGRIVIVRGNIYTSSAITAGSASGQVYIAGLPFTASVSNLGQIWTNPDTANYNSPLALATGVQVVSSTLRLYKNGTVNNSNFNVTDLYIVGGNSNNIYFQATYFV